MKFTRETFKQDELTGGDCRELVDYIINNWETEDSDSIEGDEGYLHGLLKITVKKWDFDYKDLEIVEGYEWLAPHLGANTEIWVPWEKRENQSLTWFITGDET